MGTPLTPRLASLPLALALGGAALVLVGSPAAHADSPALTTDASAPVADAGAAPLDAASPDAGADASPAADASADTDAIAPDAGDAATPDAGGGVVVVQRLQPRKPAPQVVDAAPTLYGWSVGVHAGYSYAFGAANGVGNGGAGLNDIIAGAWTIGVDAGYFFTPHLYLGGYFSYGYGVMQGGNNFVCPDDPDTTCNADLFRLGVKGEYHVLPAAVFDPWVMGAVGVDVFNASNTNDIDGSTNLSSSLWGPTLSVGGGLDIKPIPIVGFGPYVELDVGSFANADSFALHGYFSGGLRARTNLGDL